MQVLRTATLVAIFIKCLTASTVDMTQLRESIDAGDFETVKKLCKKNWGLLGQVVETNGSEFIVKFIKQSKVDSYTLSTLFRYGSKGVIEKVLEDITFSEDDLLYASSYHELMCWPEKFIGLLNKIPTSGGQEFAVSEGIRSLFLEERTDCIEPMLVTLEDNVFLSENLLDTAIKGIFTSGASSGNETWIQRLYDHLVITPAVYTDGVLASWRHVNHGSGFKWLLMKADKGDFRAIEERNDRARDSTSYCYAVTRASYVAKPNGTRRRIGAVKRAILEVTATPTTELIDEIIDSYIAGKKE